jgi:DNA (cytosine-5)-methyltransferase 1
MTYELIIDNFAGGGGASTGIERAIGRSVDIAINHDPNAIAMHTVNHPTTRHYCEDVFKINPLEATQGQPVALCWFSPDCKHFSKAKGATPVSKKIRGLAWVAVRWAKAVKPRVIILENVEEFKTWGPLLETEKGAYPDPDHKGETFEEFKSELEKCGYVVEHRELRACDYGAPTTRKRLFLIARSDGKPIQWPEPTHAPNDSLEVQAGVKFPYVSAASCIDWGIPGNSIFERKRPLAENTLKRITRGFTKFVKEESQPFVVRNETGFPKEREILAAPFLSKYYGGNYAGAGIDVRNPTDTITQSDHHALVIAFLIKYYGTSTGQKLTEPIDTIPTKDRFGLVQIEQEDYRVVDIKMRMLQPHELAKAQGLPESYIIDRDPTGKKVSKAVQNARIGNMVVPQCAEALVRSNLPELCHTNSRSQPA